MRNWKDEDFWNVSEPVLVFVYGTLRNDSQSKFLGDHATEPNYTLYDLGGFPGTVPGGETSIIGQVLSVPPHRFYGMLRYEGFPTLYRIHVVDTQWGEAAMFVYNRDPARGTKVESGEW